MSAFSFFREQFYSKFYLMIPLSIIVLACLGSAVAYFIALKGNSPFNLFQMFVCIAAAMSYLAVLLGQFKKKVLIKVLAWALITESLLLVINLAF